jgi:hypothetical protein
MLNDALYLREKAQYCVVLARACRHLPTSQALEALGVELMEKAAELEEGGSLVSLSSESRESKSKRG